MLFLVDFYRMLVSTTNSFANISGQGFPILALFVLIDRTTGKLINSCHDKVMILPIVIGTLGTVTNNVRKNLDKVDLYLGG